MGKIWGTHDDERRLEESNIHRAHIKTSKAEKNNEYHIRNG